MKNMRAAVVTRPLIFYHPKGEFKNDLILSGGGGEFVVFTSDGSGRYPKLRFGVLEVPWKMGF